MEPSPLRVKHGLGGVGRAGHLKVEDSGSQLRTGTVSEPRDAGDGEGLPAGRLGAPVQGDTARGAGVGGEVGGEDQRALAMVRPHPSQWRGRRAGRKCTSLNVNIRPSWGRKGSFRGTPRRGTGVQGDSATCPQ